jgi:DNA-binding NarL/FixJ family response regulator
VGVFEKNDIFRAGIAHVVNSYSEMEVVAESGSAEEALRLSSALSPNVVVLDSDLLQDGLKVVQSLAAIPSVNVLILALSMTPKQASDTFAVGAKGYVFKGVPGTDLREAVHAVHRGEGYVSPSLAAQMMLEQAAQQKNGRQNPAAQLNHQEEQIFTLLCAGLKNQEIGARLNVAERTVKHYITRIFDILSVRNRVEAAAVAKHRDVPTNAINPSSGALQNVLHKPHGDGALSDYSSAAPSGKTEGAACFETIFGNVSQKRRSHFPGTHILLPAASAPRKR